jgi:hypothetical protein
LLGADIFSPYPFLKAVKVYTQELKVFQGHKFSLIIQL